MRRVLFTGFAKLAELEAHLAQLLLIFFAIVRDVLTHRALELNEIVLRHIPKRLMMKNLLRNEFLFAGYF